jgi:hypothetical protein
LFFRSIAATAKISQIAGKCKQFFEILGLPHLMNQACRVKEVVISVNIDRLFDSELTVNACLNWMRSLKIENRTNDDHH